jgi:hypothetical protein
MPPVPRPAAASAPPPSPPRETVAIDVPPPRDTVAVDVEVPPAAPTEDTGGIGGLFANAEPDTLAAGASVAPPVPVAPAPPRVVPTPVEPPAAPAPAPRVVPPMPPLALPKTGVLPVVTSEPAAPTAHPGWAAPGEPAPADEERSWTARRGLFVALGALAIVVLAVVVGVSLLGGGDDAGGPGVAGASSAIAETPTGPQPGDTADVGGQPYTAQVVDLADSCRNHAYGRVAEFLAATDCAGLSRALWTTEVDGQAVVVSVSRVRMPDTGTARQLQALADTTGTGNVNDLLRERKGYPGGPPELAGAEYASAVSGPVVTIVESSWVRPGAGDPAAVDAVADEALVLETPPFPE